MAENLLEIEPVKELDAAVEAPPSKAFTLRALFIASLASGKSRLLKALLADDQIFAIKALKCFGAEFTVKGSNVEVEGNGGCLELPEREIFVGNSGVTARLIAAYAALAPIGRVVVRGDERMETGRPIQELLDALGQLGVKAVSLKKNGFLPIAVEGGSFVGGGATLRGSESSQYYSSILISAPYAERDVRIVSAGEMRSKPYVAITMQAMSDFGVRVENKNYALFCVESGQRYRARTYRIEGDYSSAAYFFAAAAITGGRARVSNLNATSVQGDRFFVDCLERMGCRVERSGNSIAVAGGRLSPITVDMGDYPDIVQPLAVVAAFAEGRSVFTGIGHLRFKECDRLYSTAAELRKLGVNAVAAQDSLAVEGNPRGVHGALVETYNDHRMAMSFAVAGLRVKGIKIKNPACVKKSFPSFFEELCSLGG
jgi:3-phosphoshikimate 1-carboxyvinyltransferase